MMEKTTTTVSEEAILTAARNVFIVKGMAAARMQEIADEAGINKAMLHYYFRSKDKLFERVFKEAFKDFWPNLELQLKEATDVKVFLKTVIASYIDLFLEKPFLPNFIISEINNNPERLEVLMRETGVRPLILLSYLEEQIKLGTIQATTARELMVNIISMCIFPFAARPLMSRMIFNNDQEAFNLFLLNRKETIFQTISQLIFVK